jgi:hypothetical protein
MISLQREDRQGMNRGVYRVIGAEGMDGMDEMDEVDLPNAKSHLEACSSCFC